MSRGRKPAPYGTIPIDRRNTLPTQQPDGQQTDAELVRRARKGDNAAFSQLLDRHGGRMFGLARSLLGHSADAEDVVQDTFAAVLRGLRGFRGEASVKTWMTRILVNKVAKFRRSRRVRRTIPIDAERDAAAGHRGRMGQAGRSDIRMDVASVLRQLSPEHRDIIVLREMQRMSYDEMAAALAIPRGTVESRLHRARQKLKDLLRDYLP